MNTPGMHEYKNAFYEHGIPVAMDSKTDISSEKELSAFVRLYAFIANPYDRTAREGALEALWKLGLADTQKNEEILETLALDTKEMSAYGAAAYLVKRPELYLPKDHNIEDHRIYDIQKKIVQMTEAIRSGTYGNKGMFLEALRDYCAAKVEHELIMEKDIDAVRFMNLHKAKGLEGGIVIWANRIENKTFHEDSYRSGRDFYPSLKYSGFSGAEWCAVSGDKKLMDNARLQDECENIRLEYVAATRAKQALIFMDRYNAKEGNMFTTGYNLDSLPAIAEIAAHYEDNTDEAPEVADLKVTGTDQRTETAEKAKTSRPAFSSESPSDYENDNAGRAASSRNSGEDDVTESEDASTSERKTMKEADMSRPTGAVFGTVMHRAFELVVDRWNCSCEKLGIEKERFVPACIDQAVNESADDIPEGDVEKIKAFLYEAVMAFGRWFVKSDIKKRAEQIYTELPFSYLKKTDDENSPDIWMHGEADLVARLDDGSYYILDYKSDNDALYPDEDSFTERLRGKYSPQIDAYTEAVSRVFKIGPDKIGASLVSFSQKDLKDGEKLRVRVTDIR
jgi:ATP-dependent helicase/nuclease subunit A